MTIGSGWLGLLCLVLACSDPKDPEAPEPEAAFSAVAENAFSALALRPIGFELSGDEDPIPSDVPSFPGAELQMFGLTENRQRFVSLRTRSASNRVYIYYYGALLAAGWQLEDEASTAGRFVLVGRKSERQLSISVQAAGNGSEIALETTARSLLDPASAFVDRELEPLVAEPESIAGL